MRSQDGNLKSVVAGHGSRVRLGYGVIGYRPGVSQPQARQRKKADEERLRAENKTGRGEEVGSSQV